ncbi:MAG: ribulose-phosphate 3-epimerase [Bacteriovoracaceae bacterium]|nr:ribulose-phosphate 3-epimerase [Bacteroidota bacterium]
MIPLKKELVILPSVLSANFAQLGEDIRRVETAGATLLHLDVMDGHFVPNISFGPAVVKAINSITELPLDTHLMIESPDQYLEHFRDAGANILTVHAEACTHLHRTISRIKELGMHAGVSVNPATSLTELEEILPYVDLVLIMSVNPGFGGQRFIATSIQKIRTVAQMIVECRSNAVIEVDGGIDPNTIKEVIDAGAQYLVAGNAVFGNGNIETNFSQLHSFTQRAI